MLKYILKRLVAGTITIFVLITATFFLMHAIPGGPFSPAEEKKVPASVIEAVNEKYGLNDPVYVQYGRYLKGILEGDLGISFKQQSRSVNDIIERGFPVSARVGILAALIAVPVGISIGIISAIKRGRILDYGAMAFATIGISIPSFILTVLLMYLFCNILKLLPTYGLTSWKHYILPVICLAFGPISYIARLIRSSMLEVIRYDYIRTARAKGVSEFLVIMKHALKNACIPVVTYLGPMIAGLLTGSFIIERLFAIPGMGRDFVTSISDRDYSVILGMTIFFGAFVILANIVVDILYCIIDPRISMEG
ncbi:ABC transporter permease [uncultured Clostridium sp.]|uniref:ABC transporter permease n=1 Tax=uncultured Clostridium sp. TaxID=59620 RepID=UPI0027DD09CC|nr:ABC transporter permease [uncultured Clostridium sp.]